MAYIEITKMLIVYLKTALVTSAHLSVFIILDFAGDKMLENNKLWSCGTLNTKEIYQETQSACHTHLNIRNYLLDKCVV